MGPYCKFCNQRCFMHIPATSPAHVLAAYGSSTIAATCPEGKEYERNKIGVCADNFDDAWIANEIEQGRELASGKSNDYDNPNRGETPLLCKLCGQSEEKHSYSQEKILCPKGTHNAKL